MEEEDQPKSPRKMLQHKFSVMDEAQEIIMQRMFAVSPSSEEMDEGKIAQGVADAKVVAAEPEEAQEKAVPVMTEKQLITYVRDEHEPPKLTHTMTEAELNSHVKDESQEQITEPTTEAKVSGVTEPEVQPKMTDSKLSGALMFEAPQAVYPWHSFQPSVFFACFNLALQLVLLGAGGSFLFGFCMSGLNSATRSINSSFLQCGSDGDIWARFNAVPLEICAKHPECSSTCKANGDEALCEGGYNQKYGSFSPEQCNAVAECKLKCGVVEDHVLTKVRCPGGYNDLDCPSLRWYNSITATSILIGATIGSLTGSRLLAMGRRTVLIVTMVVFLVGITSCSVANSFSGLLWGRLIVGYAVGLVSVAAPTYMAEVTPKDRRGTYGVMHQLMIVVGLFIPNLLGLALEDPGEQDDLWAPGPFQLFWWRFMVSLGLFPALFVLFFLLCVYTFETPVYYVEQRRFKDAASLLMLIHGKEDIKEELDSVIENVRQGELSKQQGMTFITAFSHPEYRHVIIVGCLISAFQQFGGINVYVTSSNAIFKNAGLGGQMQTIMSIIMGIINIVMTFPTLYLIERMGRRSLLLVGSAMQFLCVVPAAIMYWIDKDSPITQSLAIFAVLGFVTFFAVAYGPVMWVYLFEIYPMEIKDIAAGVAIAVNWTSGVIMVFVATLLTNQIAFTLFAVLQLVGTGIVFFLMKESRGLPLVHTAGGLHP